jgi:hypothetical protein
MIPLFLLYIIFLLLYITHLSNKKDINNTVDLLKRSLAIPDIISALFVIPKTLLNSFDDTRFIIF